MLKCVYIYLHQYDKEEKCVCLLHIWIKLFLILMCFYSQAFQAEVLDGWKTPGGQ